MVYHIIMVIAAFFGIYGLYISRDAFARVITLLMIIAVALTQWPGDSVKIMGFQFYILPVALVLAYAVIKTGLSVRKRAAILLIALPVFCAHLYFIAKWPGVVPFSLMCIVATVTFLVICFKDFKSYKNEIGFLAIMAADATIKVAIAAG